jgi:hypothetical protein
MLHTHLLTNQGDKRKKKHNKSFSSIDKTTRSLNNN